MYDKLGLRLRFALFFAALAVGGVVALVGGLWLGASRAGGPIDGYVIAGLVGSLGIIGLSAWIGLLFDENVARPILGLSADLSTRAAADIGGKDIDEMPARYLGALAPAANAINTSLAQARTAQSRAIASETHQLQREKRLFEALVRDLTEGVIITKSDQRVMLFNRSAQNLLDGLGLDRRLPTLLRPGPLNQALARLAQRLPQEKGRSESFMTTSIDGSRYLLGQISRIESPQGFVITLRDTTQKLAAYAERDDLFNSLMDGIRQPATIIGTTLDLLQNAPDLDADRRAQLIQAQSDQLGRMTACLRACEARAETLTPGPWPMVPLPASDVIQAAQVRSGQDVTCTSSQDWLQCDPFAIAALLGNLMTSLAQDGTRQNISLRSELNTTEVWMILDWDGPQVLDGTLQDWLDLPLSRGYGRQTGRDALIAHRTDVWTSGSSLILPLPATIAPNWQAPAPWSDFYDFDLPEDITADALADAPLNALSFVVFDTETTGLSPRDGDQIVQIAGVRIVNGKVRRAEVFDTLVNPERSIPPQSTLVHGITNDMVAGADTIAEVGRRFHAFCHGAVLVAHNAPFDMAFLKRQENRIGLRFDHPVLCTVLLSAVLFDASADHSLDGLCERLGVEIPAEARHTALGDALATAEVFAHLIGLLERAGITTLRQAIDASNRQTRLRRAQEY